MGLQYDHKMKESVNILKVGVKAFAEFEVGL
jgi:hypothetical protein